MAPSEQAPSQLIIISGRAGRHHRFNQRLFKVLVGVFAVLMAMAIVASEQIPGGVPWWRDLLFFVVGPFAVIGVLIGVFWGISRLHAQVIDLRCSTCRKTFTKTQATALAFTGRCPFCQCDLEAATYLAEGPNVQTIRLDTEP